MTNTNGDKTLRKFRRERAVGRYFLNPVVKALSKTGTANRAGDRTGDHRAQDRPGAPRSRVRAIR